MHCLRCATCIPAIDKLLDIAAHGIQGNIARINCKLCNHFIALKENDEIIDINKPIKDNRNSWEEVKTNREKLIYYILSQIIYPEFDTPRAERLESLFDLADHVDTVILRWLEGKAIGFYTIKIKGTKIPSTGESYAMFTLDTAYIRLEYRNRGFGLEILSDVVARFPNEDIGLSKPISEGMWKVLRKFLMKCKEQRMRFWEIQDGGNEGSRKLVWFMLKKQITS